MIAVKTLFIVCKQLITPEPFGFDSAPEISYKYYPDWKRKR
jgi:hypothetical protein